MIIFCVVILFFSHHSSQPHCQVLFKMLTSTHTARNSLERHMIWIHGNKNYKRSQHAHALPSSRHAFHNHGGWQYLITFTCRRCLRVNYCSSWFVSVFSCCLRDFWKMPKYYEDKEEDTRACAGIREDFKACLLQHDCVVKVRWCTLQVQMENKKTIYTG